MQLAREDIVESNKLLLKKAKAFNTHPETFKDNKREFTRDVVSPEFQAWVRLLRLLSRDLGTVGLKYSSQVVYLNQGQRFQNLLDLGSRLQHQIKVRQCHELA